MYENKLKELRESKNMTQEELANAVGVTQQAISNWEKGIRRPPAELTQHFEDIFGVKKENIFFTQFNYKMLSNIDK